MQVWPKMIVPGPKCLTRVGALTAFYIMIHSNGLHYTVSPKIIVPSPQVSDKVKAGSTDCSLQQQAAPGDKTRSRMTAAARLLWPGASLH